MIKAPTHPIVMPAWAVPFFTINFQTEKEKGRRRVGTAASLQNSCLEGSIPSRPANLFRLTASEKCEGKK